ncbi:YciI family protein [Acinetobacter bereziniae]|uniref:YciI family protein n=1 Tax=Acinetobacter bereziniae TaxID=106648 RepID=UPI0012509C80|nr:hypothetical protein [Acinetobacter bereziniae]MDA3440430.1 hypothetical protein [Acinetobacter bereziniae]
MFIVFLRFSDNKNMASQFIEDHKDWLNSGFKDGIFFLSGSIQPHMGGMVAAHGTSLPELEARINKDPFVIHRVVSAEIIEVSPTKVDERLCFLLD